ncbi:MAG: helix-hairpin-helix domain-containing protein, partial [Candidatus Hydrogenedentes bacterium]|nr:helix-hairpin-helix domain-containing protein [Candidatus Hydrogenedentota bacterium]
VGIAVGSGPGGRDLLHSVQVALRANGERNVFVTLVQDIGLLAYVHSALAAEELPDMDEAVQAAVSLARRLRDPLWELVKVDPVYLAGGRSAVGVNRKRLQAGIARTLESVVNRVGVDVNTAPVSLLRYVSGLQAGVAQAIIEERDKRQGFTNRTQLLDVSGVGEKTYLQCAGFLRIMNGENKLDASSIHPDAYPVIERIAESLSISLDELLASPERIKEVPMNEFATEITGLLTLEDICYELGRVGHDPRRHFRPPAQFLTLESIDDLQSGMVIEGIITNVTDFGAFVNIGLAQEGLVHRSELGRTVLNDPKQALLVGDVTKIVVLNVEKETQKISLSIKGAVKLPLTHPDFRRSDPRSEGTEREGGRRSDRGRDRQSRNSGGFQGSNRPQRRRGKDSLNIPKLHKSSSKKGENALLNTSLAEQLSTLRGKIVPDEKKEDS